MAKVQRLTIILTAVNLILLAFGLAQLRPASCSRSRPGTSGSSIGNCGRPGARSCGDQGAAGTTDAQDARRHNRISGGRAIAPDQFAESART